MKAFISLFYFFLKHSKILFSCSLIKYENQKERRERKAFCFLSFSNIKISKDLSFKYLVKFRNLK